MSGHSRWAGIKHKKAVIDKKRGKIFTKIVREIMVAARHGGDKVDNNPRLRKAIEDAKAVNMPQDNIKRAIQKGTGALPGAQIEETTYEGYGPGGVAIFVEATTDNKNRTTSELRHMFASHGGNMGESGSVAWIFDVKGYVAVPKDAASEETITALAIDAGAEDLKADGDAYEIYTDPLQLDAVKEAITSRGIAVDAAEVSRIPKNSVALDGDDAERCLRLMDALDEHDDVKSASANFDIPQETIDRYADGR